MFIVRYEQRPLSFGLRALAGLLMVAVLSARRDYRGALIILLWCFFAGWLLAAIIGRTQGT